MESVSEAKLQLESASELELELELVPAATGAIGRAQWSWLVVKLPETHILAHTQTGDSARPATLPVTFQLPPPTMRLAAAD